MAQASPTSNERDIALSLARRPLLFGSILFAGGIYTASSQVYPLWWWGALLAGALALSLVLRESIPARLFTVAVAAFCAGALLWHAHQAGPPGDPLSRLTDAAAAPPTGLIEGIVRLNHLENDDPGYLACVIDVDRAEVGGASQAVVGAAVLRCPNPPWGVHAGDRIRARGVLTTRLGYPNFGVSSYEDYWHRERVYTSLTIPQKRAPGALERVASAPWWSGRRWMSRLRKAESDKLAQCLPASVLPFVKAVWLGYRASMPREEYQAYVKAGVAHILSVSGIHASILFVTLRFLLALFIKNRRAWAMLTLLGVALFALTTGMRPSALRAALMMSVFLAVEIAGRDPDAPSALGLSALLLLAWNPSVLFDTGFQLSFLSLASIMLFPQRLEPCLPLPAFVRKPLATSIGVQVLPLPIAVHISHALPVAGMLVNLVVIPLSALILWLTFVTLVVSLASTSAAALFGHAIAPIFWVFQRIVQAVAASDWTWLRVASPTPPAALAFWGSAFMALVALSAAHKRNALTAAVFLALASVATWGIHVPEPRIDFLSVRNGDAIVVMSPRGRVMLVDGADAAQGPEGKMYDDGEDQVAPFLWAHQIRHLDHVVLTHPDRDHIGGLFYILENFSVGTVWMAPEAAQVTPLEQKFLDLCDARGVPVRRAAAGDQLDLGGMAAQVLHPPAQWGRSLNTNERSLVLRIQCGPDRVLLTGDIQKSAEALLAKSDCAAEAIKAPHHGSGTSSSPGFIHAVHPADCIVTCSGLPSRKTDPAVLAQYQAAPSKVWRTDQLGGIRLTFTKTGIQISHARK